MLAIKHLAVAAIFLLYSQSTFASLIFINEFHYDNQGRDNNEFIEIAGPSGFSLNGWLLSLYNGASGQTYNNINLSGTLAQTASGKGFLSIPVPGIQNGSPDGFALIDDHQDVVQFLSYEGTFTATNGHASGLISTKIPIEETSTTPEGWSLQLTGSGQHYDDFQWRAALASAGRINVQQRFQATIQVMEPSSVLLFLWALAIGIKRRPTTS